MAEQGDRDGEATALSASAQRGSAAGLAKTTPESGDAVGGVQAPLQLATDAGATGQDPAAQRKNNNAATAEPRALTRSAGKPRKRRRSAVRGSTVKSAALRRELATMSLVGAEASGVPDVAARPNNFAVAFAATAADRKALDSRAVRRPNANVPKAVSLALRAVPFLDAHRATLAGVGVNVKLIDRIDTYARALSHAHALLVSATDVWVPSPYEDESLTRLANDGAPRVITRAQRLKELVKRVIHARIRLRADVTNLMVQGSLPPTSFKGLSRKAGYQNTANDVLALVHLIRNVDAQAASQSALSSATLDQFTALAHELFAYAARRGKPGTPSEQRAAALDEQARAFTLLWLAYREAQRAVATLLWDKGDYRDVLPSLMVGVGRKRG